jgi:hypothetical protein
MTLMGKNCMENFCDEKQMAAQSCIVSFSKDFLFLYIKNLLICEGK